MTKQIQEQTHKNQGKSEPFIRFKMHHLTREEQTIVRIISNEAKNIATIHKEYRGLFGKKKGDVKLDFSPKLRSLSRDSIGRILRDMVAIGWVIERPSGKSVLFSLQDDVLDILNGEKDKSAARFREQELHVKRLNQP